MTSDFFFKLSSTASFFWVHEVPLRMAQQSQLEYWPYICAMPADGASTFCKEEENIANNLDGLQGLQLNTYPNSDGGVAKLWKSSPSSHNNNH